MSLTHPTRSSRKLLLERLEDRRVMASGTLDPTFGFQGIVNEPLDGFAEDMVVQPDGKTLVVGRVSPDSGNFRFQLVRYNNDGSLDATFGGGDGIVVGTFGGFSASSSHLALRGDGKIWIVGSAAIGLGIARLNVDGSFDGSFDGDGRLILGEGSRPPIDMELQADSKLLVSTITFNGPNRIFRINDNGSPDTTFGGGDGEITTPFSGDLAIADDGKLYAGGTTTENFLVARYNADGSLDTTFAGDGIAEAPLPGSDQNRTVLVQPDGKVVLVASARRHTGLVRFNADGTLDNSFSGDGIMTAGNATPFDTALQADGRIVVATRFVTDTNAPINVGLMRFDSDGTFDASFSGDGRVAVDLGTSPSSVALRSDGRIMLAASANGFVLARFTGGGKPTALDLSDTSAAENLPAGSIVSTFTTTDPDPGDTFTYSLVAGPGAANNAAFEIVGDTLRTRFPLNFENKSSYSVRVRSTDTSGNFVSQPFTITVDDVNDRPVIASSGDDITYAEGDGPTEMLAATTTVSDVDSASFAGGSLVVRYTTATSSNDRLVIRSGGGGAGQIGVSGSDVTFGGVVIGSYSGGIGAEQLVVDFNANATSEAVQALLRAVQFYNINTTGLTDSSRRLELLLNDGDGGNSPARLVRRITIEADNAPVLLGISGTVGYALDGPAIQVAPNATIVDPNSPNYVGAVLNVSITSGADASNRIFIGGIFEVDAENNVLREGVVIGTLNAGGGVGTTDLVVTFNINASRTIAQQLLRSIRFRTAASTSTDDRVVTHSLTDDEGLTGDPASKTIDVSEAS